MATADIPPPVGPGTGVTRGFRMGRTVSALILREMASRYGRSPGGYIWALLEPLGMIAIMSIGFSLLLKAPPMGTSFLLFFGTGFVPFSLYQTISATVARTLIYSRALLTYPIISWVDAVTARFILNTLTGIMVAYLTLSLILATLDNPILLDIHPIMQAVGLAAFLGLSIGMLNCALTGLFPIWSQIWSIINRPMFLLSGVIIRYEDLPEVVQNILWYNPLIHITGLMREGFYPTYEATYFSAIFVLIVSLIPMFLGVVLLRRYHRQILST